MEFTSNDQIRVEFKDGSEIIAKINIVDGDKIQASALNKNEKYNEGDTIYLDNSQDKITKLNKRFQWAFDKHKPQYKYNPDTNVIEKDEENVTKVGMKKTASQEQATTIFVTKILGDDWYQTDSISNKILESDLPDDQKKQKLIERATELLSNDSVYDALWRDGENNKILNRNNIIHEVDDSEPVQIDENEIDTILQEYNEEKESWNEDNEMFETRSNKTVMSEYTPKQAIQDAYDYYEDTLKGKLMVDTDEVNDTAADMLAEELGINYEEALTRIEEEREYRFDDYNFDEKDVEDDNEPWIDPAGGEHEGRTPNLKQYEMKKKSHELSGETRKEVDNTFNDIKRLISEYDQTDDYNKLLEVKGILTSLLRIVEAEAKECMDSKSKEARGRKKTSDRQYMQQRREIAEEIAEDFSLITGVDRDTIYDPDGQFHQEVIDETWPSIENYLRKKYPDFVDDDELKYEIDDELMNYV